MRKIRKIIIKYRPNTIYQLFEDPDISFSWSNTNDQGMFWDEEKQQNRTLKGPAWRSGRARLTIGDWDKPGPHPVCFNFEWSFLKRNFTHISFDVGGGEEDFKLGVAVKRLFSLWFTAEYVFPDWIKNTKWFKAARYSGWGRSNGISISDDYIRIEIWRNNDSYSDKDAWWHHISVNWKDLLMGSSSHSKRSLGTTEHVVSMPEGNYPCKIEMFESTWKRPRWPFAKRIVRAGIDLQDNPIPFPGKGENSWDIDDDATYAMTCIASSPHEAIAHLVESTLKRRERYGGANWQPESVA